MTSEGDPVAQESVVFASFENRVAAERMLASLGPEFLKKARKGQAEAFVVTANQDGSLRLAEPRVLTATGIVRSIVGVLLATMAGFIGVLSMLRGAKAQGHAILMYKGHVGSDEQAAHALLAQAGPNAAIVLVSCTDEETRRTVTARAADRAIASWEGSRWQFLADLDPGSEHDWVRAALGEPPSTRS